MDRSEIVAKLREIKDNKNCACKPEELVQCLMHFDLDSYILNRALTRKEDGE